MAGSLVLYFYQSNQLDILAQLLGPIVRNHPPADLFAREQILVQSPGMAQWLKLELARQLGVVANMDFPLPASFIWKMFHQVLGDVPEQSPFNKEAMAWRLLRLLPEKLTTPEFVMLSHYLEDDEDHGQRKLWQLCQKIADIFDQYLVYRPDWTADWEAGNDRADISATQPWQPILWRELVDDTVGAMDSPYHRGNLFSDFIEKLSYSQKMPQGLPERVFVFGISALPPAYLKALEALAQHIDIYLFFGNPCQEYWGDLRDSDDEGLGAGNPLLASMGKLGRDYIELLAEVDKQELEQQPFVELGEDNLLHLIQQDILLLRNPIDPQALVCGEQQRAVARADRSICFQLCHSPRRELEVLHDQLLELFSRDSNLTPRDIIVMVPDINAYSPYIQAVFGAAPQMQQIPFAISDRSVTQENPILLSFLELLALPQSRTSASAILSLLDVPAIARRFEIQGDQLPTLRQWVMESGIRWGLDADDMQRWSLPEGDTNSWLFGLKRMLLGFAMSPDVGMVGDILPYEEVQGMSARCIGPLCDLIEALIQTQALLQTAHSATAWQQALHLLLERFYAFDPDDAMAQQQLLGLLDKLAQIKPQSDFNGDISPQILLDYCRNQLGSERGSQRFLAGQVNFATLLPMRAIPFKVVCLLGMNDADYPRSVPALGFDLMGEHPMRRGDRSRRDDDRYLFLEALLAAEQQLYISYVANSVTDNTPLEPSVLVAELRDYIAQSCYLESGGERASELLSVDAAGKQLLDALSTVHPLQPFSPDYYRPDSPLFSYNSRWLPAAQQLQDLEKPTEDAPLARIDPICELGLGDLQRFARAPCAWFFQHRLKVFYPRLEEQLGEVENFSLDALERFHLDESLLVAQLDNQDRASLVQRHMASGLLPHGLFGRLWCEQRWDAIAPLVSRVNELRADAKVLPRLRIDLDINGLHLTGWIIEHLSLGLLSFRSGNMTIRFLLDSWLSHLAYHAMGYQPLPSYLLGRDEGVCFAQIEAPDAKLLLGDWIQALNRAQDAPLPLPMKTSWAWLKTIWDESAAGIDESKTAKAMTKATETFEGGAFSAAEGDDPYISQVVTDLNAQWETIHSQMMPLLEPMMAHMKALDTEESIHESQ